MRAFRSCKYVRLRHRRSLFLSDVECGIHVIYVFLREFFPQQLHGFAKPLEMHDLPFAKEFDHVVHIRIVR